MIKKSPLLFIIPIASFFIIYPYFYSPTGYSSWVIFVICLSVAVYLMAKDNRKMSDHKIVWKGTTCYSVEIKGDDLEFFENYFRKLSKLIPKLEYRFLDSQIFIKGGGEQGFDITLCLWPDEIEIESEYWHDYIEFFEGYKTKEDARLEAVESITRLISNTMRIKVVSFKNKAPQIINQTLSNGVWEDDYSTRTMDLNFLRRKNIKYYSNNLLCGEEYYSKAKDLLHSLRKI